LEGIIPEMAGHPALGSRPGVLEPEIRAS